MPASYFERLLWHFVKTRILGGIPLFLKRETVLLTFLIAGIVIYEYTAKIAFKTSLWLALIFILIGLICYRRTLNIIMSILLTSVSLILIYLELTGILYFPEYSILPSAVMIKTVLFLWFLINGVLLLIQIAEFFASTVGLYTLWGSDQNRIFLSPLPQLVIIILLYVSVHLLYIGLFTQAIIVMSGVISILILEYLLLKSSGRIIRGTLGLYVFFLAYLVAGYIYNFSTTQNVLVWVTITIISTLFIAQGRAAMLVKEKTGVNGLIVTLIGIVYLIIHGIITSGSESFLLISWWELSILSGILAPIIFVVYLGASKRYKYYIKRDKTPTPQLFLEMASILGNIVMREVSKIIGSKITEFKKSLFGEKKE